MLSQMLGWYYNDGLNDVANARKGHQRETTAFKTFPAKCTTKTTTRLNMNESTIGNNNIQEKQKT